MATAQHYLWAAGHFLLLLSASRYLYSWLTFQSSRNSWYYAISYVGAILSYAIVCYKSLLQGNAQQQQGPLFRRAMSDENVQYLLLAGFWWMSKPIPVSLIPFATFSLFHVLTFVRSNVLPHFFPPTPPSVAGQAPQQNPFLKKLQAWIKANYDPAMRLVAYAELLILLRVTLGAITFQNSLLAPIAYAHFLRMRFYQSQFTQRAVSQVGKFIDDFVRKEGNPPILVNVWDKFQHLVGRWSGTVLAQAQPAPAAGAAH